MRIASKDLRTLLTDPAKNRKMWMTDVYHFDLVTGQHLALSSSDFAVRVPYRDAALACGPILFWSLSETSGSVVCDELDFELSSGAPGEYVGSTSSVDGLVDHDLGEHARLFSGGCARLTKALRELPGHSSEASALGRSIFNLQKGYSVEWWWKSTAPGTNDDTMVYIATGIYAGQHVRLFEAKWSTNAAWRADVLDHTGNLVGPVIGWDYLDENGAAHTSWLPLYVPTPNGSNRRDDNGSVVDKGRGQANTLYHFIVSFDGTFLKTFVNGVQTNCVEARPSYTVYDGTVGGTISVGGICWPGSSTVFSPANSGRMQNFSIYPHACNEQAAWHRYTAGITPHVFAANNLRINRTVIRMKTGVDVDEMELDIFPSDDDLLLVGVDPTNYYIPMLDAMRNGAFDGASVSIHRTFSENSPSWGDPALGDGTLQTSEAYPQGVFTVDGYLTVFRGHVTSIEISEAKIKLLAKSGLDYLNAQLPRYVFKPGCTWDLYSHPCGAKKSRFTWGGTSKTPGSEIADQNLKVNVFSDKDPEKDDGYYNQGQLMFLSGRNTFIRRPIKLHRGNQFSLFQALPYVPEPGDRFEVAPGCDKTLDTCTTKFNNAARFRGFPLVPLSDSAQGLPVERADPSVASVIEITE